MARLIGPDDGSRTVYLRNGLVKAQGRQATLYADSGKTQLANVLTLGGAAIPGSVVTIDDASKIPLIQFPDGVDTIWSSIGGSAAFPLYARTDDRLDALSSRLGATAIPGATATVGSYFITQQGTVSTAQVAPVFGVLYLWPMTMPAVTPVDRVVTEVTTVGTGVIRHGIYPNDSATGLPSSTEVLFDFGTFDVTGTGIKETTLTNVTLPVGVHWYGMAWQGSNVTPPTLRAMSSVTNVGPLNIGTTLSHIAVGRLGYFATPVLGAFTATPMVTTNMHSLLTPRLAYRRA